MGPIPFALSIHHFINSVGSDAGFASIIGLAILILLYFAQARETASLRRHAYEATERIEQLEARVAEVSRDHSSTAAPLPVQAQQARSVAAGGSRPAVAAGAAAPSMGAPAMAPPMAPAAPAGVAAPALTAATRLIPVPSSAPVAMAAAPGPDGPLAVPAPLADPPGGDGPPPATVAGGANGSSATALRPSAPAAAPGMARPSAAGTSAPRRPGVAPAGRGSRSKSRLPRALILLLGVLGVAAVVAVLLLVTGNSGSSSRSTASPASAAAGARRTPRIVVNPASVTVAVLNGTAINGLAGRTAQRLTRTGYKQGSVVTAADQTHTSTIVAYLPGFRRDAEAVAQTLKLSASAIQPVDQSTQAVACPGPGACNANVIVTVGKDLANGP